MIQDDAFEEAAKLLPFYVNGTLGAAASARIDAALATSPELRAEMAQISKLAQVVKTGGIEMTQGADASETRLESVIDRLDDTPSPSLVIASPAQPSALTGFLAFLNPKRWHPAVSLGLAVAVVAQGALVVGLRSDKQQSVTEIAGLQKRVGDLEFELASGPGGERKGDLLISVKPGAPWAAVEALLGKEGLSIVGGPSDGALTLSSDATGAALGAQIGRLRVSPLIASADKAA